MDVAMMENGRIVKCMDMVFKVGRMGERTKESIVLIKSMAKAYIIRRMEEYLKEHGKMGVKKVKEYILIIKVVAEKGNGFVEREWSG